MPLQNDSQSRVQVKIHDLPDDETEKGENTECPVYASLLNKSVGHRRKDQAACADTRNSQSCGETALLGKVMRWHRNGRVIGQGCSDAKEHALGEV